MFHYKISHVETNQNNGKRTVSTTRAWVPFSGDEHLLANTKHFSLVCVCVIVPKTWSHAPQIFSYASSFEGD